MEIEQIECACVLLLVQVYFVASWWRNDSHDFIDWLKGNDDAEF